MTNSIGHQRGWYMKGVAARRAGRPITACPYDENKGPQVEPRRQWLAGWHEGQRPDRHHKKRKF